MNIKPFKGMKESELQYLVSVASAFPESNTRNQLEESQFSMHVKRAELFLDLPTLKSIGVGLYGKRSVQIVLRWGKAKAARFARRGWARGMI